MTKVRFSKRYFLIPITLIIYFLLFDLIYKDIKDRTTDEFNYEQLILAQASSQGITSFFQNYTNELTFLAQLKYIIDFNEESKAFVARYYENHKNFIEAVTRVDAKGKIVFTYPYNKPLIGEDISYQKHVSQIIKTHKPVISDVFMSVQGFLAVALHVPVFSGDEYVGSLAILIQIDKLGKQYLEKIKIRGSGSAWLMTENGIEIFCPDSSHIGKPFLDITHNDPSAVVLSEKLKKETQGAAKGIHIEVFDNGKSKFIDKYLVYYRVPLDNTYWTILISFQEEDIYAALKSFRNRLILIFSFVFIILAYYFYSLSKVRTVLQEEAKRKEAENVLKESEERYRTLIELMNDGVIQTDENNVIKFVNNSIVEMFGYTQNELIGKVAYETLIYEEDREIVRQKYRLRKKGVSDKYELRGIRKSGDLIWLSVNGTPLLDRNGKTIGAVGFFSNITERKHAEEEVLKISYAIKQSPVAVVISDIDGNIEFVNPKFVKLTGYLPEEVIGKNLRILNSGEKSKEEFKELWETIKSGNEWFGEFHNKKKNGELFWEKATISPVKNLEGKITHFLAIKEDITERKNIINELVNAKYKAEEASNLKTSFLANMSHEIRTPLNGILGFAELLKYELKDKEHISSVEVIERSGKRLLETLNLILDFSKIEAEMSTAHFSDVNVSTVIDEVVKNFEAMAKNKDLYIKKEIKYKNFSTKSDERFLQHILNNLIKNAIVFTNEGGVTVKYDKNENEMIIQVKDTGVGIDKKNHEIIFEPFRQESEGYGRNFEGTGLGLTITKRFVEMLKGKIELESRTGEGSTFTVRLPINNDTEISEENITKEKRVKKLSGVTTAKNKKLSILIVENDRENLQYVYTVLKKLYKADTAADGYEAIENSKKTQYDIILMDINLGRGIDGIQATREIKKINGYEKTPVVALTAYVQNGDEEEFISSGCTHYLGKPFSKDELLSVINDIAKTLT
jgi:PAS domain S-box-containing protein